MTSTNTTVVVLSWSLCGVALLLTVGRYVIRIRNLRLRWDDLTHGIAMLLLIGFDVAYTQMFPPYEEVLSFTSGKEAMPSTDTIEKYLHSAVAMQILLFGVIYSVKLTFLLFYYQIFSISRGFLLAWRLTLIYVALTWFASFMAAFWSCGNPTELFQLKACFSPEAGVARATYPEVLVALNVSGDVAIMALPLFMLRTLRMHFAQKLGLACIFLLGCVTIACDIVRISTGHGGANEQLSFLWDILEPSLGVIISALPTYRSLFLPASARSKSYRSYDYSGSRSGFSRKSTKVGNNSYAMHSKGVNTSTSAEELKPVTVHTVRENRADARDW